MTPTGPAGRHPRHGLDEVIHAPVRLSVVATLSGVDKAEFSFVRDAVEITDSALSKQVAVLEQAGYVTVTKGYVGKRPRTWLSLSAEGRMAFERHLAALTEIAGQARGAAAAGPSALSAS
ncbi:hypothetical protein GCM10009616_12650 [Microlunatus lacustris]